MAAMVMAQGSAKGRTPPPAAAARRMQVVPYLAQKMPIETIADLFKVSIRTVERWSEHPDVRAALGEVSAAVVESTKVTVQQLVDKAFSTGLDLLDSDDDEVRLEAMKTICDRFGFPVTTRMEGQPSLTGPQVQIVVAAERMIAIAGEKGGGGE